MKMIYDLIVQFPNGSLFLILCILYGISMMFKSIMERNRPIIDCNCECCVIDEDDEE